MAKKVSCISTNSKTMKSIDLTTNCPKRRAFEKLKSDLMLLGVIVDTAEQCKELLNTTTDVEVKKLLINAVYPCSYCYVENARKAGFNAKKVYDQCLYTGEILRFNQNTIDKLNDVGGMRTFSFGDYEEWMDAQIMRIVTDAKARGLKLKAITKVPAFVEKFHDYFNIIHVSVDNIGDGVAHDIALQLKTKYPNVLIRSVVLKDADLEVLEPISDIITFHHGRDAYHNYRHDEVMKFTEMYPGKVCCQTGKCATCPVKCGELKVGVRNVLEAIECAL